MLKSIQEPQAKFSRGRDKMLNLLNLGFSLKNIKYPWALKGSPTVLTTASITDFFFLPTVAEAFILYQLSIWFA